MSIVDNIVNNSETQASEQDVENAKQMEKLYSSRLSTEEKIEEDQYMLEIANTGFFAKGDLSAIKAKPKNGKTNAIAIMAATLLKGFWGPIVCRITNSKILWIDTEQRRGDALRVYLRTLKLAGLSKKDDFERFQMYALRPFTSEDKMKSMKKLIKDFQPDIVFIDGIVDIMCNFNDVDESKKVIDELMRMSTKEESGKNLSIVCVLHTNKATEDHNMRGHLGTMLTQKAGTVLEVTKNKNGIFTVSNTESRNKEVPDWSFCFDNNGDIVDTTEMVKQMTKEQEMKREAEKMAKSEAKTQTLIETMKDIIRKHGGKIKHVDLRNEYMDVTGRGLSTVNSDIKKYIDANIFKKVNGFVIIADEAANNNQQNLPF